MKPLHLIALLLALAIAAPAVRATDHFAWGADLGTTIDVGGHDMSGVDLNAYFGYKNDAIDIAGVGAGLTMMVGNSSRAFPLFAILRTSFRTTPSLCFFDCRAGLVIDNVPDGTSQKVVYISPSIGFNLAMSSKFKSFITLGYTYNGMGTYGGEFGPVELPDGLSMVTARFGVTF